MRLIMVSKNTGLPNYTNIVGQTVISTVKKQRKKKANTKENNEDC